MPTPRMGPQVPTLCLTWLQIRGSYTPSLGSIISWNSSQNSGKHFTYICQFFVRATDELPGEEVPRVRSRGVLSAGVSSLAEVSYVTFPLFGQVQPGSSPTPSVGFFSLASSLKHDWLNHWPLEIHLLNSDDQMDAILFPPLKQGSWGHGG